MLLMLMLAEAVDVRDVATAWVDHHNQAIELLNTGDSEQALVHAKLAAEMAPSTRQKAALEVLAMAASSERDVLTECDALDALMAHGKPKWGLYWNGALDAQSQQMWASAYRYAQVAFEHGDDKSATAPLAFSTALKVEQLDQAQIAMGYFENPLAEQDLAKALAAEGRCEEAKKWDAEACR
jgi:tetratricopeptide (TPR) repeat protein